MESNFEEDVSSLTNSEIRDRIDKLTRDKRFINYKILYWNEIYNKIRNLDRRIFQRISQLKNTCEICGVKVLDGESKLRILPDGRKACKKCWNIIVKETLIKNANNIMRSE